MPKVCNPFDNSIVCEFEYTSLAEVDKNLSQLSSYTPLPSYQRIEVLKRLHELVLRSRTELAELITLETGKPITDALVEVDRGLITISQSSSEIHGISGEVQDASTAKLGEKTSITKRVPYGVVLCITPFNFPLNLALHKIAPAFAAGNACLLKPSECNYLLGKKLVQLCHEAGFPQNAIAMAMPQVSDMNNLISDGRIKVISFTGGTKTADIIAQNAGRKKLLFELGGNDPLIIYPGADLNYCVKTAIAGRFSIGGQKCTANKRLFIHKDIYSEFKVKLLDETKKLVIGNPLDSTTQVGPLISEQAATTVEKIVAEAQSNGAKILIGGKREGAIYYPTVVEGFSLDCSLVTEEVFGPVIPLIAFEDDQEVIDIVNSSPYGLQAGVFTNDLAKIKKFYNQLEVGSVIINEGPGFRLEHLPFGGVKDSGEGREGIKYTINEMTYIKQLIF